MLRYSPQVSLPLRALSYGTGFPWYPTASLGPQSIQRVTLSVSVAPSPDPARVQEYTPAFHPLRLSASR